MASHRWTFEPGHTAAAFRVRHMMVTWVRGHFKNVRGTLVFDPDDCTNVQIDATIDVATLATGDAQRDAHLASADFLDAERYPTIAFKSTATVVQGPTTFQALGDLTIRGVTKPVTLDVTYLGCWSTPWWENGVDLGPRTRAGFEARATIDRQQFGVSWNGPLDRGGVVVGDAVELVLDAEAIQEP